MMEQQRKGRNRKTIVNLAYNNSGEYKRKFDNIAELSRFLYKLKKFHNS